MSKVQDVVAMYKKGFVCSQAMLSTYGMQFGIDREIALKVAAAFGGGMGRMGETCGAVTGAFMLIGLKCGNTKAKDKKARRKTDELVREFVSKFEAKHGSIRCKDLLGYDLSTSDGWKTAKKKKLFKTVCSGFVQDAAEIIEQMLK